MAHLFHKRKQHSHSANHDIEASPNSEEPVSCNPLSSANLSEYAALESFISTYREDGYTKRDFDNNQKGGRHLAWWKLWQSSEKPAQQKSDAANIPRTWLETDIRNGIEQSKVVDRRKVSGWNELTAEKENMIAKFLSFFTGPILYGKDGFYSLAEPAD